MTDLSVSFTASRDLDDGGRAVILNVLMTAVPLADCYITGGCEGGDAFIGLWLHDHRPDARHVVIVPADRSRVDPWWLGLGPGNGGGVETIDMPPGTTYADRNYQLVLQGTMMFGFPAYPERHPSSARSGSWQTCRMARRAGKLSQWACVKPPYAGRIEHYPSEFCTERGGTMSKTETDVKTDLIAALEPLDDEARARVLRWALARFAPSLLEPDDDGDPGA